MSFLSTLREYLPFLVRPRSTWLHLRWYWKGRKYRRIRRDIHKDFDDNFYLSTYPEVRRLRIGPVRHYILVGWKEGKDPSETFSTTAYLEMYHDVGTLGVNPFQHYLTHGRQEGRIATVSKARQRTLERPSTPFELPPVPAADVWAALPKRLIDPPTAPAVNVVIPVYKSLPHVATTLHSVLAAHNETPFECLVVDDCSPEPEVSALLARLAASGHIRLIVNETNRGFVASVNRGMAENPNRDVIILNADTKVHEGWIDRLMTPLRDDPRIATVTPLSNNATIASYPHTATDNDYELEVDSATLDRLAARANGSTVVDVPTGVGFCMAIRRTALAEVGLFDEETFGLGYGEECDFCMRALKVGWRNVMATGVYVRHYGSASFGASQVARSQKAQALLAAKHPDYAGRVARHIAADPVLPSRVLFDVARLAEALGSVSVLFFSHTRGGGVETFLENTRLSLLENGFADIVSRGVVIQTQREGFIQVAAFDGRPLPYLPNLESLNLERHKDFLERIIAILDPELCHMNSFAGLSVPSIARLIEALTASNRPYWHVWHDHQPLCPRLTFLDAEDRYCGETDVSRCVPCLAATTAPFEWVRISDWRDRFRAYLANAEVVSAPSEEAALRARRLVDVSKVKVHPHPEPHLLDVKPLQKPTQSDGKRHILILGAIGPHKGAYLLHAMLQDIAHRNLPLHLEVVGYTSMREIRTGKSVTVHGRYHGDAAAVRRIEEIKPDLCLVSSIWPETYVFTLSVALALHLPTVSFDLGAQAERIRDYGRGVVLERHLMEDPVALNNALLGFDLDELWSLPARVDWAKACPLTEHFKALRRGPTPAEAAHPGAQTAANQNVDIPAQSADPRVAPLS
ncbi:glycosyltransferase [Acuticoccus mangrovi]|uniref:glycosyltransferase n=1 Tax=Acuticoccus mangrovi TaxID=2796142 RepID=UPI001B3B5AC2|nr:glycosyltransferase [Acuticoccus mangrovi]